MEKEIVIIDGARIAIGKFNGSLKDFGATELAIILIKKSVNKKYLYKVIVDEVMYFTKINV